MNGIIARQLAQATAPLKASVDGLQNAVGVNEAGNLTTVDERIKTVMGQDYPIVAPGQQWPMSNNHSAHRLDALEAAEPTTYPFANQSLVSITHNRGRYVTTACYDQSGNLVEGALSQPDTNTLQVIFSQPFSGTVVLS